MRTTRPIHIVIVIVLATAFGWLFERSTSTRGMSLFVPPLTFGIIVLALAVLVFVMSLPVRRRVKGGTKPLDPLYAVRSLALAKSAIWTGSIFTGFSIGLLLFMLSLTVAPRPSVLWITVGTGICSIILLAAGIVAEQNCKLPPSDSDKQTSSDGKNLAGEH